ncbi:MAG: type II toxin-antitoxin system VapC family toxin [Deltaproteobacteria bacterium]|nr:type II toxin-antitoxin system VapC family toxin [Deltaproteobacteria bacterium]
MIFVDTNIFMYAVGKDHPYKLPSLKFFEESADGKHEIAINVEVLQEILYRFWAIRKIEKGYDLFGYAKHLSDWILPISQSEIDKAKDLMKGTPGLSPRDALHAASMLKNRISTILSYDQHFDQITALKRIEPAHLFPKFSQD